MNEKEPLEIFADNMGAIALVKDEATTACSKHINVVYHFARDYVEKGLVIVNYVPSADVVADGLTKPFGRMKHEQFMKLLGVGTVSDK